MVKMPAHWLAKVFLLLRRSASGEAQALAAELQPFTEQPGQRVRVPRAVVLRTERALHGELARRPRRSEEVRHLIRARSAGQA
ncbi:hypothetical protein [Streptomyces sp. NBC_01565]|uniref:hypothetical protein n=1 Tax=unclassified Streptomyces TaxID=2593676 RepID=UPI00225BF5B9|nr:hypothetical protein [Streptomyces sp. NBC_01565]MCX4539521.1 hypothetical protein [Streptomyces sp. NBC_01565]